MTSFGPSLWVVLALATLYLAFLAWYGGYGKPLSREEIERFMMVLGAKAHDDHSRALLDDVRALVAQDDGKEFVMQNLVRYRPRALYPPGFNHDDDPRAADRRYARAIIGPLLRYGNVVLFVARRAGRFVDIPHAPDWHYVAMVRYRSRRDFLRFACVVESQDIAVHKWAAIETTHIFPVKPLVSLFLVRCVVALGLACLGLALCRVLA